jgi:hypothetical protein
MMLHEIGGVEHEDITKKNGSQTPISIEHTNPKTWDRPNQDIRVSGHAAGRGVRHVDRLGERGRCGKVGGDGGGVASHAVIVRWCCDSCDMKKT